jgi:hypothetical protein
VAYDPHRMHPLSRLVLRVTLAVALLTAWSAGLVHPLVHADENGNLVHLAASNSGDDRKPSGASAGGLCDVLANLGACLPVHAVASLSLAVEVAPAASASVAILPGEAPPFLAQGPPALL